MNSSTKFSMGAAYGSLGREGVAITSDGHLIFFFVDGAQLVPQSHTTIKRVQVNSDFAEGATTFHHLAL